MPGVSESNGVSDGWVEIQGERLPVVSTTEPWIGFEVVLISGRAAGLGFRIQVDDVELWRGDVVRLAVFRRDRLREWLGVLPSAPYAAGVAELSADRSLDSRGGVALSLPGLRCWVLSPWTLASLQERV